MKHDVDRPLPVPVALGGADAVTVGALLLHAASPGGLEGATAASASQIELHTAACLDGTGAQPAAARVRAAVAHGRAGPPPTPQPSIFGGES